MQWHLLVDIRPKDHSSSMLALVTQHEGLEHWLAFINIKIKPRAGMGLESQKLKDQSILSFLFLLDLRAIPSGLFLFLCQQHVLSIILKLLLKTNKIFSNICLKTRPFL